MYYEINVSFNGSHFFATHERSITTEDKLKKVLAVLQEKFQSKEGFEISITYWQKTGEEINIKGV